MKQLDGRAVVMKLVVDGVQRVGPPIVIRHHEEPVSAVAQVEVVETPTEQLPVASDSPGPEAASE